MRKDEKSEKLATKKKGREEKKKHKKKKEGAGKSREANVNNLGCG